MRFLPLGIIFLLLTSCSIFSRGYSIESLDFMDRGDIVAEFKEMNPFESVEKQEWSDDERKLFNHLVDESAFFPELTRKKQNKEARLIHPSDVSVADLPVEDEEDQREAEAGVDLRYRDTPVKAQDDGKCTAYAGVAILENILQGQKEFRKMDMSEWHIWSKYRQYSVSAFISAAQRYPIADEKYYPQYGRCKDCDKKGHTLLKSAIYIDNDVNKMMAALDRGNPVYLGMSTPKSMLSCAAVVSPYSRKTGGGHALAVVGYYIDEEIPGKVIGILKNSWGPGCGDNGYQYVPLGYLCKRRDMYCMMWEMAAVDSTLLNETVVDDEVVDEDEVVEPDDTPKKICKRRAWPPRCWRRECCRFSSGPQ